MINLPFNSHFLKVASAVLLVTGSALCAGPVTAQELNAEVTIDRSRISNRSLPHLGNMKSELESYMNEYRWTDVSFETHERIGVDIRITLMSADDNFNFEANLVIRSRRPIYNSVQQTQLFIINDENWIFNYTPNRGFIHDQLLFDDLTSVIDFYAYIIIGYDFDSFSELGGTPYFSEAQNIVSLAQGSSSPGWSRSGSRRNREQLVRNLLNPSYDGLRRAIYRYHRQGLDRFVTDPAEARQQILRSLDQIRRAKQSASSNMLFDIFFNAKYRELVTVFQDAPASVRLEAYDLLSRIDQSHLSEYEKLR